MLQQCSTISLFPKNFVFAILGPLLLPVCKILRETNIDKSQPKQQVCKILASSCELMELWWFLAETPGVSQCYDAQGRSAGKVVADKNGNTILYNDKDVPIATGSVQKLGERSYQASDQIRSEFWDFAWKNFNCRQVYDDSLPSAFSFPLLPTP